MEPSTETVTIGELMFELGLTFLGAGIGSRIFGAQPLTVKDLILCAMTALIATGFYNRNKKVR